MKRALPITLSLLAVMLAPMPALRADDGDDDVPEIVWKSVRDAVKIAKTEGKPIVILFSGSRDTFTFAALDEVFRDKRIVRKWERGEAVFARDDPVTTKSARNVADAIEDGLRVAIVVTDKDAKAVEVFKEVPNPSKVSSAISKAKSGATTDGLDKVEKVFARSEAARAQGFYRAAYDGYKAIVDLEGADKKLVKGSKKGLSKLKKEGLKQLEAVDELLGKGAFTLAAQRLEEIGNNFPFEEVKEGIEKREIAIYRARQRYSNPP